MLERTLVIPALQKAIINFELDYWQTELPNFHSTGPPYVPGRVRCTTKGGHPFNH